MGKTIVIQYITIDGVVEDPDGSDGTPFGGWAMRYGPEGIAGDKFNLGEIMSTGVLLFGRRTWDHFSTLWTPRDTEFAKAMNAATKAVVTHRSLGPAAWSNSAAVPGALPDWVRATTQERDLVVIGSGSVVRVLEAEDLVDEYRLLTIPTAVGSGRGLFTSGVRAEFVSITRAGPGVLAVYTTR